MLLADTMRTRGELQPAREIEEAYVQGMVRTRGMDDRDTLIAMSNLAETLSEEGDLDRAKATAEQAVSAMQRALGPESEDTQIASIVLAHILLRKGEYIEANAPAEKIVEVKIAQRVRSSVSRFAKPSISSTLGRAIYAESDQKAREVEECARISRLSYAYHTRLVGYYVS